MRSFFSMASESRDKGAMNKILSGAIASLLLTVTSFGQTNVPADTSGPKIWDANKQAWARWDSAEHKNWPDARETLAPQAGELYCTIGPALVVGKGELPDIAVRSDTVTRYGGFIAGEYFVSSAISVQASFGGFADAVEATLGSFHATATAFDVGLAGKLYPLQIAEPTRFRIQPYIIAGIDGAFFDVSANTSSSASIDPAAIGLAGAGTDILINSQWALTLDGAYYHSLANTDAKISGVGATPIEFSGVFVRAGMRFRFW